MRSQFGPLGHEGGIEIADAPAARAHLAIDAGE